MNNWPASILFDLDGTLVDTAPDLVGAINELLDEIGKPTMPLEHLRSEASNGSRGLLRATLDLKPGDSDYLMRQERFLQLYAARIAKLSCLFDGVSATLAALDQHQIPWGVVTNKPGYLARPLLKELGLKPAVTLGGDATSRPKPAPDALDLACAHLRMQAADCWYVGDAPRDCEAAHAAGMYAIAAAYGYTDPDHPPDTWGADAIIEQPMDLLKLLKQ